MSGAGVLSAGRAEHIAPLFGEGKSFRGLRMGFECQLLGVAPGAFDATVERPVIEADGGPISIAPAARVVVPSRQMTSRAVRPLAGAHAFGASSPRRSVEIWVDFGKPHGWVI